MKIKKIQSIVDSIREPIVKAIDDFEATVQKRREICWACPKLKINAIDIRVCSLCGCPIMSKSLVPNTHCPDTPQKW